LLKSNTKLLSSRAITARADLAADSKSPEYSCSLACTSRFKDISLDIFACTTKTNDTTRIILVNINSTSKALFLRIKHRFMLVRVNRIPNVEKTAEKTEKPPDFSKGSSSLSAV
jgi:hypothetical protein